MSAPREFTELEVRAKAGDLRSQYMLSAALRRRGRKDESREWLGRAAAAGYGDAIFTQATITLRGVDGAPPDLPYAERALSTIDVCHSLPVQGAYLTGPPSARW